MEQGISSLSVQNRIPLREFNDNDLNKIITIHLSKFISANLSLTGEESARRLEICLPAIKTLCISMSYSDVQKMFLMYVDSKLDVTPIHNFLDRILLGKIVADYKKKMNQKKSTVYTAIEMDLDNRKKANDFTMQQTYKYFVENRVTDPSRIYAYDILYKKGFLPTDREYKFSVEKDAIEILEKEYGEKKGTSREEQRSIKATIKNIKIGSAPEIKTKCKELALCDFFRSIEKHQDKLTNFKETFSINKEKL